jgi:hypothetical protein
MSELSGCEENLAQSGHSFYFGPAAVKQMGGSLKKSSSFTSILADTTNKKSNHRSLSDPSSHPSQEHLDNITRQFFYG